MTSLHSILKVPELNRQCSRCGKKFPVKELYFIGMSMSGIVAFCDSCYDVCIREEKESRKGRR